MIKTILALALMSFGLLAICVSALGLFRFKYVLNRMHAAAVTDTLGVLGIMLGLILLFGWDVVSLKLVVTVVFMWLASPVVTHLIAKMELLTDWGIDAEAPAEEGEQLL